MCFIRTIHQLLMCVYHGLLARYVKLRVVHVPGMLGTFSPAARVSDPDMYHGTCVTHVPWCMPGSLISSFLWSRWRRKRSRHSGRMSNPQFYISGKWPIAWCEFQVVMNFAYKYRTYMKGTRFKTPLFLYIHYHGYVLGLSAGTLLTALPPMHICVYHFLVWISSCDEFRLKTQYTYI